MVVGAETFAAIKSSFQDTKAHPWGAPQRAFSYLSPKHWVVEAPSGVLGDLMYRAPRTLAETTYVESKEAIVSMTRHSLDSFRYIFDTEIIKDVSKPFSAFGGHLYHNIATPIWNAFTDPLHAIGHVARAARGIVGIVPATMIGIASGISHLIPDVMSLPFSIFGGVNKFIAGNMQRFFAGAERFSEQVLVTGDIVERGLNRVFVPAALREEGGAEYPHLSGPWAKPYHQIGSFN